MTKIVVRLNRGAKIGMVLAIGGVALGIYGRLAPADWAWRASFLPVALGVVFYYVSRFRDFTRRRKQ